MMFPELDEVEYLHYSCDDPTCDWGHTLYDPAATGISCKDSANLREDLLTYAEKCSASPARGDDASQRKHQDSATRGEGQADLFRCEQ